MYIKAHLKMYDICYTERTNDSKKMSTLNQQLYPSITSQMRF